MNKSSLDIVYVVFNNYKEIKKSLNSFYQSIDDELIINIFIIDNSYSTAHESKINGLKLLCEKIKKELKKNTTIHYKGNNRNIGFSKACNQGSSLSKSEKILFLNCDIEFQENFQIINELYKICNAENVIVGPGIKSDNYSYEESCFSFSPLNILFKPIKTLARIKKINNSFLKKSLRNLFLKTSYFNNDFQTPKKVDWLSGCCLLVERSFFESINGFDERYFLYFEDVDLCRNARKLGKQVIYYPKDFLIHKAKYESSKTKGIFRSLFFNKAARYHIKSWLIYICKWKYDFWLYFLKNINRKFNEKYKNINFNKFEDLN